MKAVVCHKSGGERLSFREVEKPVPGKGEVLVKLVFTSVNAADYRTLGLGLIPKNKIFGGDIAGVVEAVGENVRRFKVGDAVFGDLYDAGFGGFAEYVAAPEHLLALKPVGVSFDLAACVPMAAVTALQGLRNKGEIKPGKKVLVYGAGGGVGTFAVQLARYFGAEVTAVCGPNNAELVRSLGADRVFDYTKEDVAKSGKKFDLVLGVNGHQSLTTYKRMLAPKGIFVEVGGALSQVFKALVFGPLLSIGDRKMRFLAGRANTQDLEFIIKLVEEGKIKPVIDRLYPLQETPEAMRYAGQGHARGKVLIAINPA